MKRLISIIMISVMLLSVTVGCGGKTTMDNKETSQTEATAKSSEASTVATEETAQELSGKITVCTNYIEKVDTDFKRWKDQFNEKYPKVEVEVWSTKNIVTDITTRIAANQAPDVCLVDVGKMTKQYMVDNFIPLEDTDMVKDSVPLENFKGADGKVYGLSIGLQMGCTIYNKKLFAQAGITSEPKTLDEMLEACEKLKTAGIQPTMSMAKDSWPISYFITNQRKMVSDNSEWDTIYKSDKPYAMDNPLGKMMLIIKTYQQKGYFDKDPMSSTWEGLAKEMGAYRVAFVNGATFMLPLISENGLKPEDTGMFPTPVTNDGKASVTAESDRGYGISNQTKYKDACVAWLKFFFNDVYPDVCNSLGVVTSRTNIKGGPAAYTEMADKYKPEILFTVNSQYVKDLIKKAQFSKGAMATEVLLAEDDGLQPIFDKANKTINSAK